MEPTYDRGPATNRRRAVEGRNDQLTGAQWLLLVRPSPPTVPSIRPPKTLRVPVRNTHAHRPAPELRPPRLHRREPQGPRRGRGPGRRRGRRAARHGGDVPDRVRDRRRHRPPRRARRRRPRARRRRDRDRPRPGDRLRLPRAGGRLRVQLRPADLRRRHPSRELPQDPPLRLFRARPLHTGGPAGRPGGDRRSACRAPDLLRRGVPGERPRPRPRRAPTCFSSRRPRCTRSSSSPSR